MRAGALRAMGMMLAAFALLFARSAPATSQDRNLLVRSQAEFTQALERVRPGQTILLADGEWRDFQIGFEAQGREGAPITLAAQTPGLVTLTGRSNLSLAGSHLVVRGLVFRDGYSPSGEVISFRRDREHQAFHSRVTEIVIDGFNNPERGENEIWVALFGRHNRVDHSHFEGKLSTGVTLAVRLDAPESNRNHHRIDHNFFGPRPPLGSNGGETIRIGTSHNSLEDSNTLVERNIFEECDGEVEIISNKSGANVFRGNVFIRSQGSLTLRHGNNNVVEDNIFLGGGVENTGGVRVINAGQIVRNNLFVGLRGRNFTGALVVMNGVPNSPLNRYHQVRNALIERNTFIDVAEIGFGTGADAERSLAPADSAFRGNLIIGATNFAVHSALDGVSFEDNAISGAPAPAAGFAARDVQAPSIVSLNAVPDLASLPDDIGFRAPADIVTRAEVGPPWRQPVRAAREARRIEVRPGTDTISAALASAQAGDTLALAPGRYVERAAVAIDKPIAIVAADQRAAKPSLRFEGSTFLAFSGRGELSLRGLRISGAAAPDAAGNSVIRLTAARPPHNYALTIADCDVHDLRTNRGFSVVRAEQGVFAQTVRIERSSFRDINGTAFSLRGESEPLGRYSVEDLVLIDVEFANVTGPSIDVLRAGRDESTFGPRVRLERVSFNNVGGGGPAAQLHGVQMLSVERARFEQTAPIEATIEVGQPRIAVNGATRDWAADVLVVRDLRS